MPQQNRNSQILILASSFLLLLAVVSADVLLGKKFGVLLFYLVPIGWSALFTGRSAALSVAVACAASRFGVELVDEINTASRPELIWSVSTELIFFLIFTAMVLKMRSLFDEERALARTDGLTRLLNARSFHEAVSTERERMRRYHGPVSLVYFDLDNFKSVNDRLGHHTGDALLRLVGETLRGNTRQVDQCSRLGGDEFAILLPETDELGAQVVLDRLQAKLLAAMQERNWPVTSSMGCITFKAAPPEPAEMLRLADRCMYQAKNGGKNRLVMEVWTPEPHSENTYGGKQ